MNLLTFSSAFNKPYQNTIIDRSKPFLTVVLNCLDCTIIPEPSALQISSCLPLSFAGFINYVKKLVIAISFPLSSQSD